MGYYHLSYEAESDRDPPAEQADGSSAVGIHPPGPALQPAEQKYHETRGYFDAQASMCMPLSAAVTHSNK